jgi:hypothetical protein
MTREELLELARPAVEAFAAKVAGLIADHIAEVQGRALAAARDALAAELGVAPAPARKTTGRRRSLTCTVCGELGHNARRHRRRGGTAAAVELTADPELEVESSPPPAPARPPRPAAIPSPPRAHRGAGRCSARRSHSAMRSPRWLA